MSENNEVVIEINKEKNNKEKEKNKKPEFLIDETEEETDASPETETADKERTIETVEAELEELKEDFKKQLEAVAESEREQYQEERDRLLRTAAEAENSKKRIEADAEKQLKFANRNILEGLIPVLDSLEAALKSVAEKVEDSDSSTEFSNFSEGVAMVHKQLMDVLKIYGLTPIQAIGEQFDPNQHEAVIAIESDEVSEGNVIEEYRSGYQLHDQVLRAAQVVVSKGKAEKEVESEDTGEQQDENSTEQ